MNISAFAARLASLDLTELDKALALLWFDCIHGNNRGLSVKDIADQIVALRLGPSVNASRLSRNLRASRQIVTNANKLLHLTVSATESWTDRLTNARRATRVAASNSVLPIEITIGTSAHFETWVTQINGSYDIGYFDACAVLMRRLTESLLILSLETQGKASDTRDGNGSLRALGDLVIAIKSASPRLLHRGSDRTLDQIKFIGDRAAHHRSYKTTAQDIDDVKIQFRGVINELLVLSKLR